MLLDRGAVVQLAFGDEPSSFEAALQETKERTP